MSAGITLVTGGARAGKSALAERLAAMHGAEVLYVATAEALDDEMSARVAAHRAARPPSWRTLEASRDVAAALRTAARADAVLLDCLTVWTSNVILDVADADCISAATAALAERTMFERLEDVLAWQKSSALPLVAVTNEVGLGVVPPTALGRLYRDVLGRVNQRVAAAAEEVYLVVAGLALPIKAIGAAPLRAPVAEDARGDSRSARG